jgi:hypothetical protein
MPALHESRPASPLGTLADVLRPRKARLRATALALLSLVLLSGYIFLVAQPSLTQAPLPLLRTRPNAAHEPDSLAVLLAKYRHHPSPPHADAPPLALDAAQELAAVTSFMAALPQNVLPPSVDPAAPLDPTLVLDFDARSPAAKAELDELVRDVWTRNPVVVFSKVRARGPATCPRPAHSHLTQMRSPVSRELKSLLEAMKLHPAPTFFDVDQRGTPRVLPSSLPCL